MATRNVLPSLSPPMRDEGQLFMGRLRRHLTLFAALLTAVLLLVACGGEDTDDETVKTSPPSALSTAPAGSPDAEAFDDSAEFDADGDDFLTVDEHLLAVRAAFDDYRWPDGYTPTVETMTRSLENAQPGDLFQVGLEHTMIESWQECAWYRAWLDAFQRGDAVGQEDALQVMTDELPGYRDAAGAEILTDVAQSAALDDPSLVMQRVEGRCMERVFDGPT
jgi:hypothetical protein